MLITETLGVLTGPGKWWVVTGRARRLLTEDFSIVVTVEREMTEVLKLALRPQHLRKSKCPSVKD